MTFDNIAGLVVSLAILAYLVYALISPEKL